MLAGPVAADATFVARLNRPCARGANGARASRPQSASGSLDDQLAARAPLPRTQQLNNPTTAPLLPRMLVINSLHGPDPHRLPRHERGDAVAHAQRRGGRGGDGRARAAVRLRRRDAAAAAAL